MIAPLHCIPDQIEERKRIANPAVFEYDREDLVDSNVLQKTP